MPDRRSFLAGLVAAGLTPRHGWADVGGPAFLSAGMTPDGAYALFGLGDDGAVTFQIPIPSRGHAAAAHPTRAEAVAFARRPGRFAIVIDCAAGREIARLTAPDGRHFYGHGVFSQDGARLYTTENDYAAAQGRVGVWDARRGYARITEFGSGGIGPHDIKRLSHGDGLVIANGGIETHPDTGRAKLNLPTMRPNLSYLDADGRLLQQIELAPHLRKNSVRHLAMASDGTVAFAMQWQGDVSQTVPLLALHSDTTGMTLLQAPDPEGRRMLGYAGSIAITPGADRVAITSPRGGLCQVFSVASGQLVQSIQEPDICGVAAWQDAFFVTAGTGRVMQLLSDHAGAGRRHDVMWDNHLVALS